MMTSVDTDLTRVLTDPLGLRIAALPAREALRTTHLADTEPCGRFVHHGLRPDVIARFAGQFADLAASARTTAENKRARP